MRIAVGIASAGRPEILQAVLNRLSNQSRRADRTIVSVSDSRDLADPAQARAMGVEIISGVRGLTGQRNALVAAARGCDILAFFDDDFVPCDEYLEEAENLFQQRDDIALATGDLFADGIVGPGLAFALACSLLDGRVSSDEAAPSLRPIYNGYGCNMVINLAPVLEHGLKFDERLPLYGWLEDVDFSRRLAEYGKIVRAEKMRGVHLGVKRGRQSGVKLGYSQIANPLYLMLKRTMDADRALWLIVRNIGMNLAKSVAPEPYVDRRGRLAGNLVGLFDLVRLRLRPERILEM